MMLRVLALALMLTAGRSMAAPLVAADIPPVQSIAARVMQGVGAPEAILPPGASPHGYALRPSEARLLQNADVVIWVGPELTPWLADPIDTLAAGATVVALDAAPDVELLLIRQDPGFEPHADEDHAGEHAVHEEPAAGEDPEHEEHGDDRAVHEEHAGEHGPDEGHAEEHAIVEPHPGEHAEEHEHGGWDGHLWLDPRNAAAAARAIAAALAAADPENADAYAANAEAFAAETEGLEREIEARLAPLRGRPYLVFHDAYQYFERRFGIPAAGSIAVHDGVTPGAARVGAIRDRVRAEGIVCAFSEPQFEPKLINTVVEGTNARIASLDPLGAALEPGPELYPTLLRNLANDLAGCLEG